MTKIVISNEDLQDFPTAQAVVALVAAKRKERAIAFLKNVQGKLKDNWAKAYPKDEIVIYGPKPPEAALEYLHMMEYLVRVENPPSIGAMGSEFKITIKWSK